MQIKKLVVVFFAVVLLAVGLTWSVSAARQEADGLVVVQIGDVTVLENVNTAANLVIQACDVVDAEVQAAILATIIDIDEGDRKSATFCKVETGQVKVTQNTDD